MKLFVCNGRRLNVYDIGYLLVELRATTVPIKEHGIRFVEDELARQRLRELLATNLYERTL